MLGNIHKCTLNYKENPVSVTHEVNILEAPTVKLDAEISADEGTRLEIVCEAEGAPQPTFKWMSPSSSEVLSEDPTLVIESVRESHDGYFTCSAANSLVSDKKGKKINVYCK